MTDKKMLRPCAYLEWAYCEGKCDECLHSKKGRQNAKYRKLISELEMEEK